MPTVLESSIVIALTSEVEGPLPFLARLITTDTVTVMLQTLDLVLDSLGAEESSPT